MIEKDDDGARQQAADPDWFREPTAREHAIGAGLFVAFGVFFVLLFFVERGWGFRWVMLGLGLISIWRGAWHWTGIYAARGGEKRQG
jgi:hypothetical protein